LVFISLIIHSCIGSFFSICVCPFVDHI
jgi:hypothetical protein